MYDTSKFCERLKELIEEKEITPQILASAIDYGQVYSWLSGCICRHLFIYLPSFQANKNRRAHNVRLDRGAIPSDA